MATNEKDKHNYLRDYVIYFSSKSYISKVNEIIFIKKDNKKNIAAIMTLKRTKLACYRMSNLSAILNFNLLPEDTCVSCVYIDFCM